MLLDLWEWFLLISDGIDLVISNLASGTYPIPLSFLLLTVFFGIVSYFAWRSTDIPDLPPAPRPPYVIQITAGPSSGSGGSRQTIQDVRLLSGGAFFDRSEILSGYHHRSQATNTESNSSSTSSSGSVRPGTSRNVGGRQVDSNGPVLRRRTLGRSFLLGLFRRPSAFPRTVPVPSSVSAIRAQLNSPNVVVYHRVNVYHHHIHNHIGPNANTSGNNPSSSTTPTPSSVTNNSNPSQTQGNPTTSNVSTSSATTPIVPGGQTDNNTTSNSTESESAPTPTSLSSSIPLSGASSTSQPSPVNLSTTSGGSNGNRIEENSSGNVAEGLNCFQSSSVQIDRAPSIGQIESNNMPARSSGDQGVGRDGSGSGGSNQRAESTERADAAGNGENDVRFTIKFLNDSQLDVTSQLSEKIVDFKRRHFATEMSENKTVRLIFNGRVLDNDNKTLREFGIFDQCVVHCLIVSRQQSHEQSRSGGSNAAGSAGFGGNRGNTDAQGGGGNIRRVGLPEPGMFFVAFIGIFLVFLWFLCLHFGQHLFTQSAVVSLTVLTAIFLIGIVACYLPLPTT